MTFTQFLVVESPADMRTAKRLADLDQVASRVAQIPGVTKVSGVTRPTGERLDQAKLSWQNGQIGDKMASAVADGHLYLDRVPERRLLRRIGDDQVHRPRGRGPPGR